jgi:hypothetical protein
VIRADGHYGHTASREERMDTQSDALAGCRSCRVESRTPAGVQLRVHYGSNKRCVGFLWDLTPASIIAVAHELASGQGFAVSLERIPP